MIRIWNEVVEEGIAFPQEECLFWNLMWIQKKY